MNHYKTTLNYFDNRSTNASAESVNSNSLNPLNDPGEDEATLSPTNLNAQDVFGYSLHNFDHDFSGAIGGNNSFVAAQPMNSRVKQNSYDLYNGNIATMVTTITNPNTRAVLPLGNAYKYDQLNRLKEALSFNNINVAGNTWNSGGTKMYYNAFDYDANGNIINQVRCDDANQPIDDMSYYYEDQNGAIDSKYSNPAMKVKRNRLRYVRDGIDYDGNDIDPGMASTNYQYDFEGRLIHDKIEEIDQIYWRVDGKIKKIKRTANSQKKNITFDYDAMGNRIAKHVYTSNDIWEKSTYYVLDAQGNLLSTYVYENNNTQQILQFAQTEKVIYGSSRLGTNFNPIPLFASQNSTQPVLFITHNIGLSTYELTNHLGNVLSVISDKPIPHQNGQTVDYWQAEVRQATDYSPFGAQLQTRNLSLTILGNAPYRFGFNNMERDDELKGKGNSYDFGARMLDPRLGRWLTIDPHSGSYPDQSPYSFSLNSPIAWNDPDGMDAIVKITNEGGKKVITMTSTVYIAGNGVDKSFEEELQYTFDTHIGTKEGFSSMINGEEVVLKFEVKFVDVMSIDPGSRTVEQQMMAQWVEKKNSGESASLPKTDESVKFAGLSKGNNMIYFESNNIFVSSTNMATSLATLTESDKETPERIYTSIHELMHLFGLSDRYNQETGKSPVSHTGFENDWMGARTSEKIFSSQGNGWSKNLVFSQVHVDNLIKACIAIGNGKNIRNLNGEMLDKNDPNREKSVILGVEH